MKESKQTIVCSRNYHETNKDLKIRKFLKKRLIHKNMSHFMKKHILKLKFNFY